VWAIREGRQAARAIDEELMGSTVLPNLLSAAHTFPKTTNSAPPAEFFHGAPRCSATALRGGRAPQASGNAGKRDFT
ncbi:hypothetical protein ACC763_42135, partial [Rhizobium ruizarguesonis]